MQQLQCAIFKTDTKSSQNVLRSLTMAAVSQKFEIQNKWT